MPLTPHMSPAAIGWRVVMLRGRPSASKRAPIAASVASGHPSADEDETVTIAPSGMRRAASAAEITFGLAMAVFTRSNRSGVSAPERAAASAEIATLKDLIPSSPVAEGAPRPATASWNKRTERA